jgi:peptidyl-prolyl cis-trans isomerase D
VPADFRSKVQVTDAEVEAYYQANGPRFQSPEAVDLEYLVLDLASVEKTLKLNETDVRAYYDQNQAKLAGDETRRASHILLTLSKDASASEKAAVRAKAESLLAQLKGNPALFADLAKRESQDPGSAKQGGDLGFFGRNDMVKPFSDAAFGLSKGALSGVVETEFGLHLISLTDIKAPVVKSFEAMRPQLEAELRRQQAQKSFAELSVNFSDMVYEQSDNLSAAAAKFGLAVQTQKGVERAAGPDSKIPAVLASPKLLEAVFAEDSIRQKRNISAVEAAPGQLVSARVLAHYPAAARPLKEVAPAVRDVLLGQKAAALAKTEGEAQLKAWKEGAAPTSALAAAKVVSRMQPQGLPARLLAAAMTAQLAKEAPAWAGVDLGEQGYAVVRVNKVLPREAPVAAQAEQERQQLNQLWAQAEGKLFLQALRKRHEAVVLAKDGQAVVAR